MSAIPDGLTTPLARALATVSRNPGRGISMSHAAAAMGTTQAQASRLLNDLVARGWATREPDPGDLRTALFRPTPLGAELGTQLGRLVA